MANTVQRVTYGGTGDATTTTPPQMGVFGPGLQYTLIANGTGGQFVGLNLPPISLSASTTGQTVDVGLVDSANHTVEFSAMNPALTTRSDGRHWLSGSSSALAQPVTVKTQLAGRRADRTGYVVVDVTNNGSSALSLSSIVLSLTSLHFTRSRYYDTTAATGDAYTYDATNHQVLLTNSAIAGVTIAFSSNFGALPQHYQVTDAAIDPLAQVVGAGALANTLTATATSAKWVYLAIGDSTHQASIAAGATSRFVFILAAASSQAAVTTLITAAQANYTTDLSAYDALATATRLQQVSMSSPLDALLDYALMAEHYAAHGQTSLQGYTFAPAGAYVFFSAFTRDGYLGALAQAQVAGNTSILKDMFAYLIANQGAGGSPYAQQHEMFDNLTTAGIAVSVGQNGTPGDQDLFAILIGYEYYVRTLDSVWLTANIANVNNIANYLLNWYNGASGKSSDGLFCGASTATYLDSEGNILSLPYLVDPVMTAILIHALRAVVELNTAAGNTATAATYTTWRTTLLSDFPALWNTNTNWLVMNKSQDGTQVANNVHLMKMDALAFDALTDTTKIAAMLNQMAGDTSVFWNATDAAFNMMPTTDPLYNHGDYWYGQGWNLATFRALGLTFRYGTPAQAQWAWKVLQQYVQRKRDVEVFAPGEHISDVGLFQFSAGGMVEMLLRDLWGIDAHAQYFTLTPVIYKLALGGEWSLTNLVMGGSTWTVTHSGVGPTVSATLDGIPVSGNINYPTAGTHSLVITASGRGVVA